MEATVKDNKAPENAGGGGSTSVPAQHPGAVHKEADD